MATLRARFFTNAALRIRYAFGEQRPGDPSDGEKVVAEPEAAIAAYRAVRELHPSKRSDNQVYEVWQSWSPEESKKLSREEVNQMGRTLAEKYFEGHQFLVVTHSNRAHLHNHIIVNVVNMDTGKRLQDKMEHIYAMRRINDEICKARGLSIPNQAAQERRANTPEKVRRMQRYHGHSYILDTMEKADFARKYATSFSDYKAILLEFGIGVQIEKKNITYFYPGKSRGKRGRNMGRKYDKPFLEKTFEENAELYRKSPELRAKLREGIETTRSLKGESLKRIRTEPQGDWHDHGSKSTRKAGAFVYPSDEELRNSPVPFDEIHRARSIGILEYCKRSKIPTATNDKGQLILRDRPFVVIDGQSWTNTKNKTQGTLIELVSSIHRCSFVQAIARINDNPRLLLLEEHVGAQHRKYFSFYMPKESHADRPEALKKVERLLRAFGAHSTYSKTLLDKDLAHVSKEGSIRLFPSGDSSGAFEFAEERDGSWSKRKAGAVNSPFLSVKGNGKKAVIFLDPFSAMKTYKEDLFSSRTRRDGLLVLMEPEQKHVDIFVGRDRHLTELVFVFSGNRENAKAELDLFNNLKTRYQPLGITVSTWEMDRGLHRPGPDLSL